MSEKRLSIYDTTILINDFIYGGTVCGGIVILRDVRYWHAPN